ncbi:hypothetical protein [Candidatus Igneacidithiobacillus taiwanensis]|uniref:hypothetical protein n=1 Tax=Candidatus Igneacidithiobacillus taiwanensis TaxID=1945924 RepID=UPI0028A1E01A|nr:hypothetical protein [Candidatus Igneacidithiobacillus taiwanensis]MCE5360545.1 hypothetical protein [Acidithiobacillus sp.]
MKPEAFYDFCAQLQTVVPEMMGVALLSTDGSVLYQEGELVADIGLVGVAGAAVMRLAEHIGSGLEECPAQEITIRCKKHAALFAPMTADTMVMVVLPTGVDTRIIGSNIHKINGSQTQ